MEGFNMNLFAGIGALIFFVIYGIIILGFLALWVFVMVLVIKLAFRGIKALDIYNEKAAIELKQLKEELNHEKVEDSL
jgi:uncharacterized membrane protein